MSNLIPGTWIECKLGDVVDIVRGVTFPASSKVHEPTDGYVACLRTSHIQEKLIWNSIYYIPSIYVKGTDRLAKRNDILMSMANSSNLVGKVCIKETDREACFGAFLSAIRSEVINHSYVYYFLKSSEAQQSLRSSASQTVNIANISVAALENLRFPLAPLTEQNRIAAKLDELLAQVDTLKARMESIPALLKRFRKSVLAVAVSGQLTEKWRSSLDTAKPLTSWKNCKIGEISSLVTSGSRGWANYYSDSGAIFIRSQDINTDELDISDAAFVKLPDSSEGKRTRVKYQDILLTITGANVGKVARVKQQIPEAYVSQHVALVRFNKPEYAPFIELFLKDIGSGRGVLLDLAYGGGKPGLNLSNIRDLQLSLPPREEQIEITRRVEQLFAYADQLEAKVTKAQSHIDLLTQSILAKAFRGKLLPQELNDEPANVLLERIKFKRAAQSKAKRGKKSL
ncbi:restriction endonuclease subunit S [Pseudomonas congelans]|uniref:restriction endonuclease subunit S n=1 Tax=Pseudomonas congelans TaxID=200452 RepID=UPI001BDCCB99|nr:restriction endonuclease subunit S [Pseudomonas congelans]QVX12091.1 type I restriction endonuclease subunit S [Pseudomonas congelans]